MLPNSHLAPVLLLLLLLPVLPTHSSPLQPDSTSEGITILDEDEPSQRRSSLVEEESTSESASGGGASEEASGPAFVPPNPPTVHTCCRICPSLFYHMKPTPWLPKSNERYWAQARQVTQAHELELPEESAEEGGDEEGGQQQAPGFMETVARLTARAGAGAGKRTCCNVCPEAYDGVMEYPDMLNYEAGLPSAPTDKSQAEDSSFIEQARHFGRPVTSFVEAMDVLGRGPDGGAARHAQLYRTHPQQVMNKKLPPCCKFCPLGCNGEFEVVQDEESSEAGAASLLEVGTEYHYARNARELGLLTRSALQPAAVRRLQDERRRRMGLGSNQHSAVDMRYDDELEFGDPFEVAELEHRHREQQLSLLQLEADPPLAGEAELVETEAETEEDLELLARLRMLSTRRRRRRKKFLGKVGKAVRRAVTRAVTHVKRAVRRVVSHVKEAVRRVVTHVKRAVRRVVSHVKNAVSNVKSLVSKHVSKLGQHLNTLKAKAKAFTRKVAFFRKPPVKPITLPQLMRKVFNQDRANPDPAFDPPGVKRTLPRCHPYYTYGCCHVCATTWPGQHPDYKLKVRNDEIAEEKVREAKRKELQRVVDEANRDPHVSLPASEQTAADPVVPTAHQNHYLQAPQTINDNEQPPEPDALALQAQQDNQDAHGAVTAANAAGE